MLRFDRSLDAAWQEREKVAPTAYIPLDPLPDIRDQGDLLSVLHDEAFKTLFAKHRRATRHQTVSSWVCSFESSSRGSLYTPHLVADMEDVTFLLFLDELRRKCVSDMEAQLRSAAIRQEIPRSGECLVFPDNLTVSYLAEYAMRADQMHVHFVDSLPNPRALLRMEDIVTLRKARSRNLAKSFIQSGHKTIFHCGILTHVDRRLHANVFGPSIDTLLLSSILADYIRTRKPRSVLEVGIGSGHIYSTAAVHSSVDMDLSGVDIEPSAVLCCSTNLRRHDEVFGLAHLNSNLLIGRFDPGVFARRFDLLVSNPPYIPEKEVGRVGGREAHRGATTGTDLLEQILAALPNLLSDQGQALLMTSSTTPDLRRWLPDEFECEDCLAAKEVVVPFDVDFTLDNPDVIERLKADGGLSGNDDTYQHALQPVWVRRRARC